MGLMPLNLGGLNGQLGGAQAQQNMARGNAQPNSIQSQINTAPKATPEQAAMVQARRGGNPYNNPALGNWGSPRLPFPDGGLAGFLFGNRQPPTQTQGWQPGIQGGRYTAMQPQWQPMGGQGGFNPLQAFLGGGFAGAMNNVRNGGYQPPANGMTPWGTQIPQRQRQPLPYSPFQNPNIDPRLFQM